MTIHAEACRGDVVAVRRSLDRGQDVNGRGSCTGRFEQDMTPLMCAAGSSRPGADLLRLLLEVGADVNATTGWGRTALCYAAHAGSLEKVRLLLDAGASPSAARQSLMLAAEAPLPAVGAVVRVLLDAGVDPDWESDDGESALSVASRRGLYEVVRELLEAGADATPLGWGALLRRIALDAPADAIAAIRGHPTIEVRDRWARSAFLVAVTRGDVAIADALLAAGADARARGRCGVTAPMLACLRDRHDMLSWLLARGCDPDGRDEFGHTPLMQAAECDAVACARVLLEAGADVSAVDSVSRQPIHSARSLEMVDLLLRGGADLDRVDGEGSTPLMSAAAVGDETRVRGLLERGARLEPTRTGSTALQRAAAADCLGGAELLLRAGADPNARTIDGWAALSLVRSEEMARLLLDAGADPDLPSEGGHTQCELIDDAEVRAFVRTRRVR